MVEVSLFLDCVVIWPSSSVLRPVKCFEKNFRRIKSKDEFIICGSLQTERKSVDFTSCALAMESTSSWRDIVRSWKRAINCGLRWKQVIIETTRQKKETNTRWTKWTRHYQGKHGRKPSRFLSFLLWKFIALSLCLSTRLENETLVFFITQFQPICVLTYVSFSFVNVYPKEKPYILGCYTKFGVDLSLFTKSIINNNNNKIGEILLGLAIQVRKMEPQAYCVMGVT